LPRERDELVERGEFRLGARKAAQMVVEQHRAAEQRAVVDVEPDDPAPVGEEPMLCSVGIDLDRLKVDGDVNPQFVFSSGQRRATGLAFLLSVNLSIA